MNVKRNNYFNSIRVVFLVILTITKAHPQTNIPIGTWRNHLAYNRTQIVLEADNKIFCASENGLFVYNPDDNSILTLSKINGLSDVSISAINYQGASELLILGYDNGNIDLIKDQGIYNLTDIKNTDISYDKKILDIIIYQDIIYFIVEFGVVVYNLQQNAIKETWQNLSNDGDFLEIIKGVVLRDSIFLASAQGVLVGDLDPGNNLMDFQNWKRYDMGDGLPAMRTYDLESHGDELFALQNQNMIFMYENGSWNHVFDQIDGEVNSIRSSEDVLTFTLSDRVYYIEYGQSLDEVNNEYFLSLEESIYSGGDLYAADYINGLVRVRSSSSEVIRPSGPFSNDVFKIYDYQGNILAVPNGFDEQYRPLRNPGGFYSFSNGLWTNYNNSGGYGYIPLPEIYDLVDMVSQDSQERIYFASFGYGLLEWDQESTFKIYNELDPDVTLINLNPPEPFTIVPSIDVDQTGKLWMSNYNTNLPLHEFEYPEMWNGISRSTIGSSNIVDLIVTRENIKWMVIHPDYGGGIIVYDDENGKIKKLTSQSGGGNLPENTVTAILEDLEGQIWIGTINGVAYFPFPFLIFEDPVLEAVRPVYENNFLFRNEIITSLEVDGGNRKWIGTNKGAWLFTADGTELVRNFDFNNSPILSDEIVDIEVDQVSGEVFFATIKGMISYRGDAIKEFDQNSEVKIFPNPVTSNFNGIVGIEGLPQNAVVKITDIAGNLVYETRSVGGIATWNVVDLSGSRPNTGIYLVFSSSEEGDNAFVGKLAIIK